MRVINLARIRNVMVANFTFMTVLLTSWAGAQQPAPIGHQELNIIESSVVAIDQDNNIGLTSGIEALGDYKYSLDNSLATSQAQSADPVSSLKVVENPLTGRIGLTSGHLIVEYAEGENGPDLALGYGLAVISQLPSINRIVVQLSDLGQFEQVKESMRLDDRVVSTELEVYYGGYKAQ
jgi:hypothetical protein